MAGYGPPQGPYVGFQPSVQPIGFEMHQPPYPPHDNSPGYPPPPSRDIYHPSTNDYNTFSGPPATPTAPSYHHHGDENGDNLPPVGFEPIASQKDQDTATTSGVKLDDRESPVPPINHDQISDSDSSHRLQVNPTKVCSLHRFVLFCFCGFILSVLFEKWSLSKSDANLMNFLSTYSIEKHAN